MLNKSLLIRNRLAADWAVVLGQSRHPVPQYQCQPKRHINKDYDKVVKLFPPKIEYKYKDSKFFNEHKLEDEPYLKLTDEEVVDLSRVKLEKELPNRHWQQIDINAEPFRQVLVDTDVPDKRFTETEVIGDKTVWFWVERLLPKRELPKWEPTDEPQVMPSGVRPPMRTKPDLSYHIRRTRGKLLPVYRKYQIEGRNHEEYWKNRWDGLFNSYHKDLLKKLDSIKFENNESTLILTDINQISGDIWRFEEDIRGELERKHRKRILSAVKEQNGVLTLKGDFVMDCVKWLTDKGF